MTKAAWFNFKAWWAFISCPHEWQHSQDRKSRWCFRCTHVQFTCTRFP